MRRPLKQRRLAPARDVTSFGVFSVAPENWHLYPRIWGANTTTSLIRLFTLRAAVLSVAKFHLENCPVSDLWDLFTDSGKLGLILSWFTLSQIRVGVCLGCWAEGLFWRLFLGRVDLTNLRSRLTRTYGGNQQEEVWVVEVSPEECMIHLVFTDQLQAGIGMHHNKIK